MSKERRTPVRVIGAVTLTMLGLLACTDMEPTSPTSPGIQAAKGGGGGAPPKVDEAVPNQAPQDTTLIVRVIGSGYDDGSVVRFLLNGEAAPKMIVNSTHFVNSDSLDVDLTIELTADTALYDIEVMTARGKKGIGSEKFQVRQKGAPTDTPVSATFRDAPGDGVTSDSVTSNGIDNSYDSTAVINTIGNLFLDARVDIPRKLCLYFAGQDGAPADVCDDGYLSTAQPEIEGGMLAMAPGSSMKTTSQVTWVKSGFNWFLRFGEDDCDLGPVVDNRATVTHPDADTWILAGTSACLLQMKVKGRPQVVAVGFFDMPFQLTLLRQ